MRLTGRSAFLALVWLCAIATALPAAAEQRPDTEFHYRVEQPAFAPGSGPVVGIDGGHNNFHTAGGRYAPFAELLAGDGFRIEAPAERFGPQMLDRLDVLVIANARDAATVKNPVSPTPSAFEPNEIEAVKTWVAEGGALLLIADHMPFAGAAADLAKAFGFGFVNGYALDPQTRKSTFTFGAGSGLDANDPTDLGGEGLPATDRVMTFTGQAFTIPDGARPVLKLIGRHVALLPERAGKIDSQTPWIEVGGHAQGAILSFGKGRVAVFGEAAAFSAQISNNSGRKVGMNADGAEQNAPFALKVMRWLAGFTPGG